VPAASIILPVRNEERHIGRAIAALLDNTFKDAEILVVNDASTDATQRVAASFESSGRVRVLNNPRQLGPALSSNAASRHAQAELLFFIDGDCTPAPDWIEQGIRTLAAPGVCAVEGAIYYDQPTPTFRHRIPINPFYNLRRRGSLTVPATDYPNGNFAIRLNTFAALGGFNAARYRQGREDTDLGLRAAALGTVAYNPDMKVTHKEELWTFRALLRNAFRYEADVRIFKDHGDFPFRWKRVLHPRFLVEMGCPLAIPLRYPIRSWADLRFIPQYYLYLVLLRLVIWRAAFRERVLIV
jgi:GT2 family glycosyltransferase